MLPQSSIRQLILAMDDLILHPYTTVLAWCQMQTNDGSISVLLLKFRVCYHGNSQYIHHIWKEEEEEEEEEEEGEEEEEEEEGPIQITSNLTYSVSTLDRPCVIF